MFPGTVVEFCRVFVVIFTVVLLIAAENTVEVGLIDNVFPMVVPEADVTVTGAVLVDIVANMVVGLNISELIGKFIVVA